MGLFRNNDRVSFNGRLGTVVGIMPNQMIDIRFDDRNAIERRSADRLRLEQTGLARRNPSDEEEKRGYVAGRITPKPRKQPPDEPFIQLSEGVRLFPAGSQPSFKGVIKFPTRQSKPVGAGAGTSPVSSGGSGVVLDSPESQAKALQIISDPRSSEQQKEYAASLVPELVALKYIAGPTMSDFEWLSYLASLSPAEFSERVASLSIRGKAGGRPTELRLASEEAYERLELQREREGKGEEEKKSKPIESLKVQKTGFIRKTAVDTSVDGALKSAKAAVFIQDDPPRMAPDNASNCGNPIDGNAYYIVVAEEMPRSTSFWVKKSDVENSIGSKKFEKYAALKRKVADFLESRYRKNVYPVAGVSQVRKTVRPRGTVGGGLDSKLMIRQKRAEPLYAEVDPSVAFALADEHNVHTVRRGETIQQLAIRYAVAGDPRATEANIRLWNDLPEGEPEVGQPLFVHPVYFKVSKRESATEGALSRFDMYQRRFVRLVGPESFKAQDVSDFGALTLSVLHAFRSDPSVGINLSRPLVQAMIRSGWVSVNYQPVLDPFFTAYEKGAKAIIGYPWKANNPFFSWVRSDVAIGPEGVPTAEKPCLSQTDIYVKDGLQVLRSMLRKLESAFGRTRSLFDRLANNPELFRVGVNGDVFYAVQSLSTAIAGLVRWEARLQEGVSVGDTKAIALRDQIINIFLPREDGELTPVLDSSLEGSFWWKLLTGFQTSSDSMGLVGYDGLLRTHVGGSPRLYAANIARLVNKLQRSGISVTRVDKKQGTVEYIIPRTKVKSEIFSQDPRDSEEAYDKFRSYMDGLVNSARFRRMDDEGKPIFPEPGASALNFFKGENEHPVSDLYAFILPSLDSESAGVLNTFGESTKEFGINQFRNSLPPDANSGKLQQDAFKYSEAVGLYASGGVRTRQQQTTDPLIKYKLFYLRPPPSLQHPFEDQKDYNWVIHLVVNEVFPSLKERMDVSDAMKACADLLLLAYLYRMAGGYELAGPLNPANQQGSNPLFRLLVAELLRLEAKLSGGSSSLNEYKVRTVYMTYNPVLFQATRLYWPTLGEYIVPPSKSQSASLKVGDVQVQEQGIQFSNVLAYPQLSLDIDRVGVYGLVAQTTQSAVINSFSEEEVTKKLGDISAGRVVDQTAELILRNRWVQVATNQLFNVPKDWYELFLATWQLGDSFEQAEDKAQYWATNPLEYLATIKQEADQSIARGSRLARVGVMPEKHQHTPTGRMPVVFRRPVDEGVLMDQVEDQRRLRVHQEAIDRLIAEQKKKLGGS